MGYLCWEGGQSTEFSTSDIHPSLHLPRLIFWEVELVGTSTRSWETSWKKAAGSELTSRGGSLLLLQNNKSPNPNPTHDTRIMHSIPAISLRLDNKNLTFCVNALDAYLARFYRQKFCISKKTSNRDNHIVILY